MAFLRMDVCLFKGGQGKFIKVPMNFVDDSSGFYVGFNGFGLIHTYIYVCRPCYLYITAYKSVCFRDYLLLPFLERFRI